MKLKRLDTETVYLKRCSEVTFEVNGKKVRVETWQEEDCEMGHYDAGEEVNESDLKALTELEVEQFGEELNEWLEMKDGEEKEIEDYE
jgi:hypothetical protein